MILIIGYGNSLRGDDGAGLLLAERLEQAWQAHQIAVERLAVQQLMPELAWDIAREAVEAVLFVDTRVVAPGETEPGLQISLVEAPVLSPSLGHHLDPAVLLTYARLLYGKTLPAWLVTVPGVDFEHGETLSQTAQQALDTAPEILIQLLEVLCGCKTS
jgi:hydrogenase maturation protease